MYRNSSKEEIRDATRKMKNNTTTRSDGMPGETEKMFCTINEPYETFTKFVYKN
jgi:hypothetical protein